ncbi:MAG: thermonuclease family protein [Kiritimatiellae bacterium]|jgi:endonuclease YncB( thermonuclease family)|nr:thermonuclease family protein [Kiritimatiellia bacterium]
MNARKRNQLFVTLFLLVVIAFTCVMTFYVGPRMMAVRDQVAQDRVLFKCQRVIDGNRLEVQLRGWERPNTNPMIPVQFAGLDAPPLAAADHPEVIAWAERHGFDPEQVASIGSSSYKTLLAFIRKQNIFLYREEGEQSSKDLAPNSRVHVMVSGTNVNYKQIESGLALHDTRTPHAHSELYAEAQAKAKAEKRGLWR